MMQPRSEDPTHEQIETRAYELYLKRGGEDGHALEDWLTAEDQLRRERQEFERLLQAQQAQRPVSSKRTALTR